MNLWHLEWLRLVRTRSLLALLGAYAFFGFVGPLVTASLDELIASAGGGITIVVPEPTPAAAVKQFSAIASQIGLLIAIVVAASALCIDARPEIGVFFRTRVPSAIHLLTPRYVVVSLAIVAAFVVGVLATWYGTTVLIGPPDTAGMVVGTALGALYLIFAVAVVALAASLTRSVVATAAISVVVLLALPVVAIIGAVAPFLPSTLVGALPDLAGGGDAEAYAGSAATTVVATIGLLALAVARTGRREL